MTLTRRLARRTFSTSVYRRLNYRQVASGGVDSNTPFFVAQLLPEGEGVKDEEFIFLKGDSRDPEKAVILNCSWRKRRFSKRAWG